MTTPYRGLTYSGTVALDELSVWVCAQAGARRLTNMASLATGEALAAFACAAEDALDGDVLLAETR